MEDFCMVLYKKIGDHESWRVGLSLNKSGLRAIQIIKRCALCMWIKEHEAA